MDKVASAKRLSPALAAFLTCTSAILASAQHSLPAISQHFAKRGEEVSLRCVVDNHDANAVVYWNRGSTCVAPFIAIGDHLMMHGYSITRKVSAVSQSDYYTVTVRNFTERDEGNYTCAVQSGKTGRLFSQIFSVKLVVPPKVYVDGAEDDVVRVRLSTDARIRCRAHGVPTPDVKWSQQKSGEPPQPSVEASQLQVEQNVSVLLLNGVNTSLHGSQFVCLAHNMVGIGKSFIRLYVEVPARLKGASESTVHTAVGNLETLKCTFEGNPMPEVDWQVWSEKKKAFVALSVSPKSTKYSVTRREKPTPTLTFEFEYALCVFSEQEEDARLYRCVTTSAPFASDDRVDKIFNLTLAPPVPTLRVDGAYIFADACNVSWHALAPNVTHYFLEIRGGSSTDKTVTQPRWHSVELPQCPTRAYSLRQSASTSAGRQHPLRNFTGTHIFSRLTPNCSYQVRMAACSSRFCSPYSSPVSFSTKDAIHVAPSWFTDLERQANEKDAVGYYLSGGGMTGSNVNVALLLLLPTAAVLHARFTCT